jgi:hypothetical protein
MTLDRNQRRILAEETGKQPRTLRQVPKDQWPEIRAFNLADVWRSNGVLVQVYSEAGGFQRMSVCRALHNRDSWVDQITWDKPMQLKRELGRGDRDALVVFPADADIVNVANMRHLFFPPEPVAFKWRARP